MSTARGVLTLVGQLVGGAYGGAYGAAIGGAVGGFIGGEIDGPQKASGPRLADTKVPTVSQGAPMPYLEGAQRLALNPIWVSARREIATTTNEGGKGSDSTTDLTTYTYEQDVLYYVTGNPIAGIRRIWDNGKLIWSVADESPLDSVEASMVTGKWSRLTVYPGAADQLPDPTYEAAVGVGNAPAYRQRGTVFVEGLNLGSSGQMPLLTAEVVSELSASPSTLYSPLKIYPWAGEDGSPLHSVGQSSYSYGGTTSTSYATVFADYSAAQPARLAYIGWTSTGNALAPVLSAFGEVQSLNAPGVDCIGSSQTALLHHNNAAPDFVVNDMGAYPGAVSGKTCEIFFGLGVVPSHTPANYLIRNVDYPTTGLLARLYRTDSAPAAPWDGSDPDDVVNNCVNYPASFPVYPYWLALLPASLSVTREPAVPASTSVVSYTPATGTFRQLAVIEYRDGLLYQNGLGPVHVPGDPEYADTGYWSALRTAALSNGTMQADVTWPADVSEVALGTTVAIALPSPDLADVVERQCVRAGLATGEVDVTALVGIPMRGMAITQVTPVRTILDNLMGAYLFEAVESGGKVKFVLRGEASVRTIPLAQMGASRGDVKEPLPMRRLNPIERPARVTLRFANALDDYQDGAESSDRLVDQGNGVQVSELPIVLTRTEAKRLAEVAIGDITNARFSFGPLCLNNDHIELEPTDVVTITDVDGNSFRARITRSTSAAGVHEHDLVLDDASVLTSTAVSVGSNDTNSVTVNAPANTEMLLFDTGQLRDADEGLGLYVAAKGDVSPWPGAAVLKSTDDVTYARQVTVSESAVMGTCETTLADWTGGNRMDTVNTVDVDVGDGVLSSVTYAQLLDSDANAFLIGAEVIKARVCTLLGTGRYRLSDLLRGRRGTEWASTGHAADESVVLLRTSGLRRILLGTAELSALRYYKGVTLGRRESTADSEEFTCEGLSMKPWSPVDLRGSRSSGDLTITWARRTRRETNFTIGAVPLGEAAEAYSVDVFDDNTYATVLRTLTSTSPSVAYTSAQQTTDFGSPQATVYVRIYQLSATVGRGYPLQGGI